MKHFIHLLILVVILIFPDLLHAQATGGEVKNLHDVLSDLKDEMLPLCGKLTGIARAIAGFGASWYIAARVWRHLANAEPIDFYPLFRPFALGLAILYFPAVIDIMDKVLGPTVDGTAALVENSNESIAKLLQQKEAEIRETDKWKALVGESGNGNRDLWMKYYHKNEIGNEGIFGKLGNDVKFAMDKLGYDFRNSIKHTIATILQIIYEAAALCINALRTFKLVILAIIGPLVFGLAVFDGFQHILAVYLARYVNIFLWLPIANILGALLGKIQENLIRIDITQIQQTGDTFFSTYDLGYTIFMIIGIICYFTVPSIADEVVFVGGGGGMQAVVNRVSQRTASAATYGASSVGSAVANGAHATGSAMVADMHGDIKNIMGAGMARGNAANYFNDGNNHQKNKISG